MFEIKVEDFFSAAHHLLNYNGVCENQHGHNWKVEVFAKGNDLDKSNINPENIIEGSSGDDEEGHEDDHVIK